MYINFGLCIYINAYGFLYFQILFVTSHHLRFQRQIKHHRVIGLIVVENYHDSLPRQKRQIDHSAEVAVVHALTSGQLI